MGEEVEVVAVWEVSSSSVLKSEVCLFAQEDEEAEDAREFLWEEPIPTKETW